jgi:organic radical activating enzyme/predicted Zn-ribbon and HTH transcriptional regulator
LSKSILNEIAHIVSSNNYKKLTHSSSKLILEKIKVIFKNKNIVIWGAGATGKFYYDLFSSINVDIKYFIDKNALNIDRFENLEVFEPSKILHDTQDIVLIIAGNPTMTNSILKDIEELTLTQNITLLEGHELINIARCANCFFKLEREEEIAFSECSICYNKEVECSAFKKRVEHNFNINFTENKKAVFPLVGYILGQRCTLNCMHCCESIPFIKSPKVVDKSVVIEDIKKITRNVDFISRLEFIGGEPFLHKELPLILEEVLKIENIGYVVVFTNATVMPSQELLNILQNKRIVVNFSGYSQSVSSIIQKITPKVKQTLIDHKIDFAFYNPESRNWLDINDYSQRKATDDELKIYFENCFMGNCVRVFNGSFYACPHLYSGIELGKIKTDATEYIELSSCSDENLRHWFVEFGKLPFLNACRYCKLPYDAPSVAPAIQLKR